MLAEPRSRRSYTLVPKGKPLYEDDSRFGTKLMQKMGWTKGKGLGRDESGSKDFLRVRYKNDAKGFGFEARDDQWTQHEQSFNGLLSTLNGNEEDENHKLPVAKQVSGDESENEAPRMGFGFQDTTAKEEIKPEVKKSAKLKEKIRGISLEEKSKKSRARVHYQKFTRGKDLSQYSEKDLANIFGKKVGEESHNANSQQEEEATADETVNEEGNAQFLRTGISVSDYFKMKMQAKRNRVENECKTNIADSDAYKENNTVKDEDQQKEEELPKKKKKNKKAKISEDKEVEEKSEEKIIKKKKQKSKKHKENDLEEEKSTEKENQTTNFEVADAEKQKSKKNKKKSKNKTQECLQAEEQEKLNNEMESNAKSNKRKLDDLENESKESSENTIDSMSSTCEPQKKKQKKNKKDKKESKSDEKSIEIEVTEGSNQKTSIEEKRKKKTKNNKQPADHQDASKKFKTDKTKDKNSAI